MTRDHTRGRRTSAQVEDMSRMTVAELEALLDRHGPDPHDWPRGSADRVDALCAHDPVARNVLASARALDADLGALVAPKPADSALIGRVLSSVRARRADASPALFLTPARMAAFAGIAVGFVALGATLGLMIEQPVQSTVQSEEVAILMLGIGDDLGLGSGDSPGDSL